MKILNTEEMIDAAREVGVPHVETYVSLIEKNVTTLALALANHLKIRLLHEANHQSGLGGLCADFGPSFEGQVCPTVIDRSDPGGDWELRDHKGVMRYYQCPCGHTWSDEWDCACDDRCPKCNTSCSPTRSEELGNRCDDCGEMVATIIGCPDGAEICQSCFDTGEH